MKRHFSALLLAASMLTACGTQEAQKDAKETPNELEGTWKLLRGTLIEEGDTTVKE